MTDSEKLDLLIREMKEMKTDMKDMKTEMKGINTRLNTVETKLDTVETKLDTVERRTRSIELTLENETNVNIIRVAEGHLNLSRKLDEAINIKHEDELQKIKINILTNDVRRIKEIVGL